MCNTPEGTKVKRPQMKALTGDSESHRVAFRFAERLTRESASMMKVDLVGRISNIPLGVSRPLLPLFEAVINSIHAIQATKRIDGRIDITVSRDESQALLSHIMNDTRPVVGFKITDNGIGFDPENFESFTTSDTKHKPGAKGIGRFMWLKAFDLVKISSVYAENGSQYRRTFDFRLTNEGIENDKVDDATGEETKTEVHLVAYKERFQKACPKNLELIAERLIEHCLVYFLSENCPTITVADGRSYISLNEHFSLNVEGNTETVSFNIKGEDFKLVHLLLYFSNEKNHQAHICGNDRVVESLDLGKRITDLNAKLSDTDGKPFKYAACVTSPYLDNNVNQERTGFVIPYEDEGLFPDDATFDEIETSILTEVKKYLEPFLKPIRENKADKINRFVETKAPQYRSTIKYMPDALDDISPDVPEEKLEVELHKLRYKFNTEIKEQTQHLINSTVNDITNVADYITEYNELLSKISDLSTDQLAEYVLYRKSIISLLDKSVELTDTGKYPLEEAVHRIIFPMITTSNEIDYEQQNLWLIDERLSYHHYLASDKPLKSVEVINTDSKLEPDLLIFNKALAYAEAPAPFSSVVVVEFKRPMRNEYSEEENPFEQVIRYITNIRASKALDRKGRPIPINDNTPFYAYIICDITEKVINLAENFYDYTQTPDGLGYFNFNKKLKAYIEVISYTKLVQDAKKRNRVLFEKLNLPTT